MCQSTQSTSFVDDDDPVYTGLSNGEVVCLRRQ